MKEVTAKQIMEKVGVEDIGTLTRWRKAALIPKPRMGTPHSGRGRLGYWPEWVIRRCQQIKKLRDENRSLADIAHALGSDWEAEEAAFIKGNKRRYDFAVASRSIDTANCIQSLEDVLNELIKTTEGKKKGFIGIEHVEHALRLAQDGINPVLVIHGGVATVTADFVVGNFLAENLSADSSIVVVPMYREILRFFGNSEKLAEKPSVTVSQSLSKTVGQKGKPFRYWTFDTFGFELREDSKATLVKTKTKQKKR